MTIKSKEKRKRNWRRAKLDLWQTNHQSPRSLHLVPKSVTARYIFSLFSELFSSRGEILQSVFFTTEPSSFIKVMLHETIRNDDF